MVRSLGEWPTLSFGLLFSRRLRQLRHEFQRLRKNSLGFWGKTGERQYSVTLHGDLTMHGVTRSQAVPARVVLDGDSLRGFGTFSLLQTDYDLKLASVAGGALKVKDEVQFSFNILARKKE